MGLCACACTAVFHLPSFTESNIYRSTAALTSGKLKYRCLALRSSFGVENAAGADMDMDDQDADDVLGFFFCGADVAPAAVPAAAPA